MSSAAAKPLNPFPAVSHEAWQQKVERDSKGAAFTKLVSETAEGLAIQPLYVASDIAALATTELRRGVPREPGEVGWDVRPRYEAPDVRRVHAELLADLERGARSVWLCFDSVFSAGVDAAAGPGVPCADLAELRALLDEVVVDAIGLAFDAGANPLTAASLLLALCEERGLSVSALTGNLGADPLGVLLREGSLAGGLGRAKQQLVDVASYAASHAPGLRGVCVSTLAVHEAGAGHAQEVGFAVATGVTYLRWLVDAGLSVDAALGQIGFRVGIGADMFGELSKLRALRECWGRVAAAAGASPAARHTHVHAVCDRRSATRYDPWVNMLRSTTQAFSAAAGGADALTVEGFDVLLGACDPFSRRIAANAHTVLAEEAQVARVMDPAGGSYYVEHLTEALARRAWEVLQAIEAEGGMERAVLEGSVAARIAPVAERTAGNVARRKQAITGISEFADVNQARVEREQLAALRAATGATSARAAAAPAKESPQMQAVRGASGAARVVAAAAALRAGATVAELSRVLGLREPATTVAPLHAQRLAEPFEQLRDACERARAATGKRPAVFLCNLGSPAEHKARSTFASGFVAAGGIAAIDNDGFASVTDAGATFAASGARAAVICGSDAQYAELAEAAAKELRSRGAQRVWLAGRPAADREPALRAAGIDGYLFMGCDVLATLRTLLSGLEVAL